MQEVIISQDKQKNKIVALVENGKLVEKYEERPEQKRLEGNIYLGKVENVLVGMQAAFVDIGVHQDGLVHKSQMANKFVKHPLDIVKVGDVVKVAIMEVDEKRKRISLTMKDINE